MLEHFINESILYKIKKVNVVKCHNLISIHRCNVFQHNFKSLSSPKHFDAVGVHEIF